ncbi:MAG TPA: hypothetical protein VMD30_01445 [Tepidisphaeraceae bacterium]|nr:hypothetical protein [Tepidisphaeraceae bacterium]
MRLAALSILLFCIAAAPDTQPATDPTMDWILNSAQPSTLPSSDDQAPATRPAVLSNPDADFGDVRAGVMVLSNGQKITGNFSTTLDQPIRVWDEQKKVYNDVPFDLIKSIEAQVVWERMEKEWNFKESGSDVKVYSGRTYPARDTTYTITLINGQSVSGATAAPLYLDNADGSQKIFILHKRDKGEIGQTLDDLVYVKSVTFTPAQ